jgi:hypothetical protein
VPQVPERLRGADPALDHGKFRKKHAAWMPGCHLQYEAGFAAIDAERVLVRRAQLHGIRPVDTERVHVAGGIDIGFLIRTGGEAPLSSSGV